MVKVNGIKKIISEKTRVEEELKKAGIEVFPGSTNFILIKSKIPDFGKNLMDSGIIIKDLSEEWLNGFYRVSTGHLKKTMLYYQSLKIINNA